MLTKLNRVLCAVAVGASLLSAASSAAENEYLVLCYHSVPERYNGDPTAISASNLITQLSWLRAQGYTAIGVDDVLKAKAGKAKLPAKSFLLTVDDGYEDFYTNVFPLLKVHKIPVVFAVVGNWIEAGVPIGNESDPYFNKQRFVNWAQLREMTRSGLVEVASHSYDLHHGILGNPQGNTEPAAITLRYSPATGRYETLAQRRARVRNDLERNSALIERHLGKRPRVMVWPYGAHDRVGVEEAAGAGMPINFTLNSGLASAKNTQIVPRALVDKELALGGFSYLVQSARTGYAKPTIRALTIDIDTIYAADPETQNQNLGKLLERVQYLGVNTVFLQPFARPHDDLIEQAYFPNSVLPMRADLANRVAWQLRSRLAVKVYALLATTDIAVTENGKRRRLDRANARDRTKLIAIYDGLSSHTPVHGAILADAAVTPSARDLDKKLLARVSYYRPPTQPLYSGHMLASNAGTGDEHYALTVVAAPLDRSTAELRDFIAQLPAEELTLMSLPVAGQTRDQLLALAPKVRVLQRHGLNNFLLDDDGFLDDPVAVDALREVLSLKNNPYLHVGQ